MYNRRSEKIMRMLRYGAELKACPSCDNETPVYPDCLFGSLSSTSCQHCEVDLQLLENQAVLSQTHYYEKDDPIELESRKINWDMGMAAGLKMWPELNPYSQDSNTPSSHSLNHKSAPSNRILKLIRSLWRHR